MAGKAIALMMAASSALLAGARAQLERTQLIFQHAGVRLIWLDPQRSEAVPDCPRVRVRLLRKTLPEALRRSVEVMGRAYLEGVSNPVRRSMVDAYRDQIEPLAGLYGAGTAAL